MSVPEISVRETKARLDGPTPPRLIDVRELSEWEHSRIAGSELLPLSQWPAIAVEKLTDKTEPLLIQCHHGGRSARAAAWLIQQGYGDVNNVAGGLDAWSREIDPSVPRYE
jgi:rhodanese-related sulfurtransferase